MISQNPLVRSMLIVVAFWYIGLFAFSGLHGVPFWRIVHVMPVSIMIAMIGLCAGFALAIFLGAGNRYFTAGDVGRGTTMWGVTVSMGTGPSIPRPERGKGSLQVLNEQPWWPALKERAPEYAKAVQAVTETMLAIPRLPASPYPGGHGGRSLLEHSMAVCAEMLVQAPQWVYEGQRDKRGNIRVPLTNPDEPHRFTAAEVPLLLLTGLAHDIGKMTCYQIVKGKDEGRLHQVVEIKPTHDLEGARILRRIPEVMALPMADRTALLMSVAYYHHPFGLPNSTWVTDRVRSLTELLAHTDICVGKAEGHVLLDPKEDDDQEITVGGPVAPVDADTLAEHSGVDLSDEDEELDSLARLASAVAPAPQPAPAKAAAKPAAPPSTPQAKKAEQASSDNLPLELRLFMGAIRRPGAINGRDRSQRIAWKHGENVYVMDKVMRTLIHNQGTADPVWAATAMAEANGNAAPFTVALAEQLLARGGLVNTFDGQEFSPARALFRMKTPSGTPMPVLIVKASAIPGATSLQDSSRPVEITGPLWGMNSARNKAGAETDSPQPAETEPELPREVDFDTLDTKPSTAAEEASTSVGAADDQLSSDDLPFDLGAFEPEVSEAPAEPTPQPIAENAPEPVQEPVPTPAPATPQQEEVDDELDAAAILTGLVGSDSFREKFDYQLRERDGKRHALIPLESDAGLAISRTIDQLREHGANVSRIKVARLADTNERAYVFTLDGVDADT